MIVHSKRFTERAIPVVGTLLESLEQSSVPIESHCRSGLCGVCRVKIKKGTVSTVGEPLAYFDDDEVLACCSKVTNSYLEIEVP